MEVQNNSIFFLLTLKRQLEDSLCYFCDALSKKKENDEIIKEYELDNEFINNVKDIYIDYTKNNNNSNLQNEITHIKETIKNIDNKLYNICNHEFVEEDFETAFEKNIRVKYCVHCSLDYRKDTCIYFSV